MLETIVSRLLSFPFFDDFDPEALTALARRGCWQSLAGGWRLYRAGDPSDELHFVISGRLIVVRQCPDGDEVVGYVRAGEPVGEMSMLADESHSASVFALRDTEVLSFARSDIEAMLREHGEIAVGLARVTLARARPAPGVFQKSSPRIFALIASSPSIDIDRHTEELTRRIRRYGVKANWLPVQDDTPGTLEFDDFEIENDVVLLAARVDGGDWYRFVLRHADRFLLFARRDAKPPRPFPLTTETGARARKFRLVDLVMLHEGAPACPIAEWADAISAARILNCRGGPCFERLARIIAGVSVGLVLSGGGARAYAHIGAIAALREAGVPIDFVSGASMGAIVAACVAYGWSNEEIETRIRAAFVESNPLGDHVLPVIALTKGKRVETRLKTHFVDQEIENLELPFFCVSSDIATGEARIHRRGRLRDALRATIALPGILPPVIDGDAILVDGAVINNFPTDIMATTHRGLTIGIDVARRGVIDVEAFRDPPGFFTWIARHGLSAAPPIVSLLMRTATARHEATLKVHPADIMIAPKVEGVELRDWTEYDEAVADGYNATKAAIEAHREHLGPIIDAANCE
ncbi:MAG: patatin-like phospholipase family protein [Pseudomonadota bacterium]